MSRRGKAKGQGWCWGVLGVEIEMGKGGEKQ